MFPSFETKADTCRKLQTKKFFWSFLATASRCTCFFHTFVYSRHIWMKQTVVDRQSGIILLAQAILKSEFLVCLQKMTLPLRMEGLTNIRKVLISLKAQQVLGDQSIFGSGMPTVDGLWCSLKNMGLINFRGTQTKLYPEEQVLQVEGRPCVLRLFNEPLENLVTTGVAVAAVERMEEALKNNVLRMKSLTIESIFRDFVGLSGLTFAFVSQNKQTSKFITVLQFQMPFCSFTTRKNLKFSFMLKTSFFPKSTANSLDTLLGMNISLKRDSIKLSQPGMIRKGLEILGLTECQAMKMPLNPEIQLHRATDEYHTVFLKLKINHRSFTGILNYLACRQFPDLAVAVSILSQFNQKPGLIQLKEVLHYWKYLKGTPTLGLLLKLSPENLIDCINFFKDSSWAEDQETRISWSGSLAFCKSFPLMWNSNKQHKISMSSTESEMNAPSDGEQEDQWLSFLIEEFGETKLAPTMESPT
ncbi:hypothetical protein VP01_1152g8 [Puccinia sorghi]|uniref:Uncharacterized protein n=1 Tax=Puccinia sorghi TaxID=27349 RepID=A0A0L6VRQ7_9BASI|nr:hypothetical protein VP01_1152g8 [Puccinia sorghi]